ncbi:MAG: LysE family transporter, partial [Proteobacteria bacterium]|nr:LysE family transporter [Pseudomonadota bacterium]
MEPWLLAFGLFALAMAASPGPNNVMMTASGANFGFRRSIPHMLGVAFGFPVMLIGVGLGVGSIFVLYPMVRTILQIIGGLYLLTLAWRIAQGGGG